MNEDKLSNDVFVSCLRQLLINCEPLIRDSDSIQSVQESLQRLEENDEHFYKYELVKVLKSQINDKLGKFIEETIEQYPANRMDSNHAEMIDSMTSKLISSSEYLKLSKKLKATVLNATDYLTNKYDSEIGSRLKQSNTNSTILYQDSSSTVKDTGMKSTKNRSNSFKQSQQEAQAIFDDNHLFSIQLSDGESSSSSFFNPESCVFLNQDELVILAEDLDAKRKNFAKRQNAMTKLLKMPLVDIHCWDALGLGLIDSLNEPELYTQAIKFIAKGLISTPNNVKALYCILARQLELVFTTKKYQLPSLKFGIDIRQQDTQRILISMRLINEFQLNAIHFWVRYSEKFVEDIMDSTLRLFSVNSKSLSLDSKPTPLHFLSIIDPIIKLEDAVNCCMRLFSASEFLDDKDHSYQMIENSESHSYLYTAAHLDYLFFLHSLSVIVRMVMYKSYRMLLEKVLMKGENTIQSFMCHLMVFGFKQPDYSNNNFGHLDPHNVCFNILKNVVQDETSANNCFCNLEFLGEIFRFIKPLNILKDEELTSYLVRYQNSLCQLAEFLSEMIQYKSVRKLFITNPRTILMPQSAVRLIGDIIHKNLIQQQFLSNNLLTRLISVICQLYNGSVDLHSIWTLDIHLDLIQAWKEAVERKDRCSTPTKDKADTIIFEIISWEEALSENILLLAKTRRGVLFLDKNDAINCCARGILTHIKSTQIQIEPSPIGNVDLVINQISSSRAGIESLIAMGYVQKLLADIWSITESDADDLATYHPRIWSIQGIDTACLKPLVKLIAVHSSYSAFYTMIFGKKLPMENKYSFRDLPKTLIEFIDRLVVINKSSKIHSLFNYESSHLCGLYWLSATITNLNCLLLLQSQYNFIDSIMEAQTENINDTCSEIIIDALSIERNNIIIKSSFLAGPSERLTTSSRLVDTMEQDISRIKLVNGSSLVDCFICPEASPVTDHVSPLQQYIRSQVLEELPNNMSLDRMKYLYIQDISADRIKHYSLSEIMVLLEFIASEHLISTENGSERHTYQKIEDVRKFSQYENIGIAMMIKYGINLKLFGEKTFEEVDHGLRILLSNTKMWMSQKKKDICSKQEKLGFDWFTTSIFLISQGDYKRSLDFLLRFSEIEYSVMVWPLKSFIFSDPNQLLFHVCHWVELIVATEIPTVHSSFQICGYPISEVCSMWLCQSFINIFNWSEVVSFLTLSIIMGPTFSIYFCVSLLKHLESEIKARLHNNDLIIFIREVLIDDFNLSDKIEEILGFKNTYDLMICEDLKNVR